MADPVLTFALDQEIPVQISGDRYVVSGHFTYDTGTYVAGGAAIAASSLRLDSIDRLVLGGSSIGNHRQYWVKSTGKVMTFHKLTANFLPTEHTAVAMTAQTVPFIAFGRKAA